MRIRFDDGKGEILMGYDKEIAVLRDKINDIDKNLVELFEYRMKTTNDVALLKRKHNIDVFDSNREATVIERTQSLLKNKDMRDEIKNFFQALMDISKKSQRKIIKPPKADCAQFSDKTDLNIGYLGIKGSFSHIAAEEVFKTQTNLKNYDTFEAIFEGMKKSEISYAILPAENTETGSITSVVDLLAKYGYFIVAEKLLPVSHSLLGLQGTTLSNIKKVYSHPEPLAQCRLFLSKHAEMQAYPSLSTAGAAITVSELGDKSVACIASKKAAAIYGLEVIRENIQNSDNNCTRFVVIAKSPYKSESCNKTSIIFMLEHKPGSLYNMLKVFSDDGVNVLKLESRPLPDKPFEYLFHLDFEGSIYDSNIAKTIEKVKEKSARYIYLGCYKREKLN